MHIEIFKVIELGDKMQFTEGIAMGICDYRPEVSLLVILGSKLPRDW